MTRRSLAHRRRRQVSLNAAHYLVNSEEAKEGGGTLFFPSSTFQAFACSSAAKCSFNRCRGRRRWLAFPSCAAFCAAALFQDLPLTLSVACQP